MRFQESFRSDRNIVGILIVSSALVILLGALIGAGNYEQMVRGAEIIIIGIMALVVFERPYIGLVITATSLPVIEILPPIPFSSSAVSLIGGVTLVGSILQRQTVTKPTSAARSGVLMWGALFVGWMALSNPAAALLPAEEGRNWMFTFSQLLLLAWLVSRLMNSPARHHVLMWSFSIAALISAIYSFQQGVIGESISESIRSSGLAQGANSAARYFIVAIIFLNYLRTTIKNPLQRHLTTIGIGILILGVMVTVSRTGLILLFAGIGMLLIQRTGMKRQSQAGIILALLVIVLWLFADNIFVILRDIFPAIRQGTDTVGLRYDLWTAGIRMWQDNVIQGIGIGQYFEQLIFYGGDLLPIYHLRMGAHNMYVQVLAETGIIGIMLFLVQLAVPWRRLRRATKINDPAISRLANTWFIVFVIMLLGGITKHDHYDKLIWMVIGIGALPLWIRNDTAETDLDQTS